jgi:hypothetical protein
MQNRPDQGSSYNVARYKKQDRQSKPKWQSGSSNTLISFISGFSRLGAVTLALAGFSVMAGCETSEDRQLASAQACLDRARSAADANVCMTMVQGLESDYAYLIRCSANFVAQGFNGDRVTEAFQSLANDTGAGTDPMATMLSAIVFDDNLTAHSASATFNNCSRSGVTSMVRLATVASMATLFGEVSGQLAVLIDPNSTPQQKETAIQAAITSMISAPSATQEELGNLVISAGESFCNSGSAYSGTEICSNLTQAIQVGGNNPEAIGEQLAQLLQTNN